MSFFRYSNRIFTLRPSIVKGPQMLVVKNGLTTRLLTLFLFLRKVEVFFADRLIAFDVTWFFIFNKTRLLDFNELSHIDYAYSSFGTSWWFTSSGFGRHDQVESYVISLVTQKNEKIPICSFRGEGAVGTGWVGILFGDSLVDFSGTQDRDSRQFATYLAKRLNVPIGKRYQK